mmetsp:Transcript_13868/g.39484  ORF Transcript_13868/g.39484 Transcript_13868/m.39484 type:complete len:233 (-) Transcript_13868:40-738(-)
MFILPHNLATSRFWRGIVRRRGTQVDWPAAFRIHSGLISGWCALQCATNSAALSGTAAVATMSTAVFKFVNAFVLDCGGQCREHLFDVGTRQCGCFKEGDAVFVSKLLAFVVRDDSVIVEIGLVAAEHDVAVGRCPCFDVSHPADNVIERGSVGDVVGQHESVGASKEVGSQRPKPFLSGRVPQLQSHWRSFDLDHLVAIIHADRGDEFRRKYILIKTKHQRCFTARRIANH